VCLDHLRPQANRNAKPTSRRQRGAKDRRQQRRREGKKSPKDKNSNRKAQRENKLKRSVCVSI